MLVVFVSFGKVLEFYFITTPRIFVSCIIPLVKWST